jgi:multidrug resistance efflux pump
MMVPPPPPEIPLIGGRDGIEFSTIGVPLDLMSSADLQRMKTRLDASLVQLTQKAEQRTADLTDARTRVQQFEGLYTEGVVSKRDLSNARKELASVEGTDSDIDQRIADVKSDLARVDKRLKALTGKKTSFKQVR